MGDLVARIQGTNSEIEKCRNFINAELGLTGSDENEVGNDRHKDISQQSKLNVKNCIKTFWLTFEMKLFYSL